jgi:hypothetical protein
VYARQAARILRPGGRLLLRASLSAQEVRNDLDEPTIRATFADWSIPHLARRTITSDTRGMDALVVYLERP